MAELLTAFAFASNLAFGLELELHEALIKLGDEAGTSLDLDVVQALRKCLGEQATTGKTER